MRGRESDIFIQTRPLRVMGKVLHIFLIWIIRKERQRSYGLKIQAQTFLRLLSFHSIKGVIHSFDLEKPCDQGK